MLLSVQIQTILFQLLAGWLYGLCFSLIQVLTQYRQRRMSTALIEVLFHAAFTAFVFFGLLRLNGACMNAWLMLFFVLYYRFYFGAFFHLFAIVRRYIRGVFRQFSIAKSRTLVIIKKKTPRRKRRKKRRDPDGKKKEI